MILGLLVVTAVVFLILFISLSSGSGASEEFVVLLAAIFALLFFVDVGVLIEKVDDYCDVRESDLGSISKGQKYTVQGQHTENYIDAKGFHAKEVVYSIKSASYCDEDD